MGFEPVLFDRPPLGLAWIELRARIGLCRCPAGSPASVNHELVKVKHGVGEVGRSCDRPGCSRDFWVVAICEDGVVRSAGRVPGTQEGIGTLAGSLLPSDRVALEVTGSCWEVARLLEPHVERVVVVSPDDTGITQARAKTDRLDARALARLLWTPGSATSSSWTGDRRSRTSDRQAGGGVAGDPPADDRAGREPDLRRDVHRRRLQCAESAHLANVCFRELGDLRRDDSDGDAAIAPVRCAWRRAGRSGLTARAPALARLPLSGSGSLDSQCMRRHGCCFSARPDRAADRGGRGRPWAAAQVRPGSR
jgi:hypothetical protein